MPATRTAPPATGRASLTLSINGDDYRVRPLSIDAPDVLGAFQLRKLGSGTAHDVVLSARGPSCTCGDWTYRRCAAGSPCKHIAALRAVGLLPGLRRR